jgi:TPP-dependent pyruvate/acetoin dehydrogenase alpha subunit
MDSSRSEVWDLYRCMVRIRAFEERANAECHAKNVHGHMHLYSGEEAVAAGVCSNLGPRDYVVSTHRGHGHVIAKGGDTKRMMAEIFGRAGGYCKGKGGSMHMADVDLGILGSNGIVGASLPIATGVGLACQYRGEGHVSVCFFGDGASNRGTFHESLDLAAVWNLPVVYVCENNAFAVSTGVDEHMKIEHIADRAAGYGIPGAVVDGNDVLAVREASADAVARARAGGGPTLLECKTWRHHGHFTGEPAAYRDKEQHQNWLDADPISRCAEVLLSRGIATPGELEQVHREAEAEMDAAVAFALASPWPPIEEVTSDVVSD